MWRSAATNKVASNRLHVQFSPNAARLLNRPRSSVAAEASRRSLAIKADVNGGVVDTDPNTVQGINVIPKSRWADGVPPVMGAHLMESGAVSTLPACLDGCMHAYCTRRLRGSRHCSPGRRMHAPLLAYRRVSRDPIAADLASGSSHLAPRIRPSTAVNCAATFTYTRLEQPPHACWCADGAAVDVKGLGRRPAAPVLLPRQRRERGRHRLRHTRRRQRPDRAARRRRVGQGDRRQRLLHYRADRWEAGGQPRQLAVQTYWRVEVSGAACASIDCLPWTACHESRS